MSSIEYCGSCGCHSSQADFTELRRQSARYGSNFARFMNRRCSNHCAYVPTPLEHLANTLSHAVGILPGFYALHLLHERAKNSVELYVLWIYGCAIALLFICSTAYHTAELLYRPDKRQMRFYLHMCDRAGIYIYIAAGYTPWLFLRDSGLLGIWMRYIIWLYAILGCLYQYLFHEKYKRVETLLYIGIGAIPACIYITMNDRSGVLHTACGGICYAIGVFFFKADGIIPFAHAIWHLHVLAGAFFQFIGIYYYLLNEGSADHFLPQTPLHFDL